MSVTALRPLYGDHVASSILRLTDIIEIAGAAILTPQDEVEKVLVGQPKAIIGARSRWYVRFGPDHIITQDPTRILHGDSKSRGNHQQLLVQ
jgi:hypothetical protein